MGRRTIVAKVEALGFELSPVVGQALVSPAALAGTLICGHPLPKSKTAKQAAGRPEPCRRT